MRTIRTLCLLTCFSATCLAASAQEVIHALEGTVQNINQKAGNITITNNNGTGGIFTDASAKVTTQALDKDLRADTVPATQFNSKGNDVVVLYEGFGDQRTVVAVHDLGTGTVTNFKGTVERTDKHAHTFTIKTDDGHEQAFHLDGKTIADTSTGVSEGLKYEPNRGDHIKVSAGPGQDGALTALFIGFAY